MVFSSMIFLWVFLPVTLVLYLICDRFHKVMAGNLVLLMASLIFYAWGEPTYILLMLFSITMNYVFGLLTGSGGGEKKGRRKLFLGAAVAGNLLLLAYFKYFNFLAGWINYLIGRSIIAPREITLPIGISFYTFQAMSYVVDVYRGEVKPQKNYLNLMLYISFFPQLVAGPIVKYRDIEQQLLHRTNTPEKRAAGVKRFLYGLGKKVLLANILGYYTDLIYVHEPETLSSGILWLASVLYTFQIYYDFSGYSDMAIGLGRMFGFEFQENFRYPYLARSVREYWRRWHISLSTWFQEYVYIPLGGNRKGKVRTGINLMTVFLLTGLWHGAGSAFVLWGLYHGVFMLLERTGFGRWLEKTRVLGHVYMFLVVDLGFILFRTEDTGKTLAIVKRLFTFQNGEYTIGDVLNLDLILVLILAVLCAGILQSAVPKLGVMVCDTEKVSVPETVFLLLLFFLSIVSLAANTYNPFIYFRF